MDKMKRFATRAAQNDGVKMPLLDPVTGEDSGEWLLVRGTLSDGFRRDSMILSRKYGPKFEKSLKNNTVEYAEFTMQRRREIASILVMGWSFDEPFTREKLIAFLEEAPQVFEQLDQFAADSSNFFTKSEPDLSPSLNINLGSQDVLTEASGLEEKV